MQLTSAKRTFSALCGSNSHVEALTARRVLPPSVWPLAAPAHRIARSITAGSDSARSLPAASILARGVRGHESDAVGRDAFDPHLIQKG